MKKERAETEDLAYPRAVGRAIQVSRTRQGFSRTDLAKKTGLSYPYVSEIETGKKSGSSKSLRAIAEALGMRPHDLLHLADELGSEGADESGDGQHSAEKRTPEGSRWFRGPDPSPAAPAARAMPEHPIAAAERSIDGDDEAGHFRQAVHHLVHRLSPADLELAFQLLSRLTSR